MKGSYVAWQGLIARKEIWLPTARGWLFLALLAIASGVTFVTQVYSFLSLNQAIHGDVLVVESWLSEDDLNETLRFFRHGQYREIVTVGTLLESDSYLKWRYPHLISRGDVVKVQLVAAGIPDALVKVLVRPLVKKNRTYHTALTLKTWLDQERPMARLDILSVGPHARRTWMLFNLAFEGAYPLGIIAQRPKGYDPEKWWDSSRGVRTVVREFLAYFYAKFLFYP
jgi:hypothetical protein